MRRLLYAVLALWFTGCGGGIGTEDRKEEPSSAYPLHRGITATVFWIGEKGSAENGYIPNDKSAWDEAWVSRYGGVDDPVRRNRYFPATFFPRENPFYAALPYNDFDERGRRKAGLSSVIPWYRPNLAKDLSFCKNRWIEIVKGEKRAYAQWEDVGPFGESDATYVFGEAPPSNGEGVGAGIDLSPAVRDYLGLEEVDRVDWRFVEAHEVPDGPWKRVVTVSGVFWPLWYRPVLSTSWQWQLTGSLDLSYTVEVYDVDLFDTDKATMEEIHAKGHRVVCYFSAGSFEAWRSDAALFPDEVLGRELDGWEGERWLDIRSEAVRKIMQSRLDLAKTKGCDGVEPDNVDGYANETGFPLEYEDQLAFNRFLATEAHRRGLAVGLKNDLEQIDDLVAYFDFALNEECHAYEECDRLTPFLEAGKPVFNAEYDHRYVESERIREEFCREAVARGFHTLILPETLDGSFRYSCDEIVK